MVGDILQPTHLLLILVVALLVLGPKRLPEVGRTLGTGLRDFKAAINGESTSREDDEPHGFVETESSNTDDADDATVHHTVDDDPAWEPADSPTATTTASHDEDVADDLPGDAAVEAPVDDAVHSSPVPTAEPAPRPTATASSAGFASALAASRQPTGDDAADDE